MFFTPLSRSTPMNRLRNAASSCGAPSPHLAQVLAEYHIPHPVQPVFYPPVPPPDLQQPGSIRLFRWETGDGVSPLHRLPAPVPPVAPLCLASWCLLVRSTQQTCPKPANPSTRSRLPMPTIAGVPTGPHDRPPGSPRQSSRPNEDVRTAGSPPLSPQAGCPSPPRGSPRLAPGCYGSNPAVRRGRPQ